MTFELTSDDILATEHWEGVRNNSYQDSGGVWTIGAGHTGPEVHEGLHWSNDQVNDALIQDMINVERRVNKLIETAPHINYNMFKALCDFEFNTGALAKSTLLKLLLEGDMQGADKEFVKWDHVKGKVVLGLLARRQAEAQLFEAPV